MGKNTGKWMIYGANGYTGRLTALEAKKRGLKPILAGRNADALAALGRELGFETRVFDLADTPRSTEQLKDIEVVLHCAGPFSATSAPMLAACAAAKAHYLDITGEIDVFEYAHTRDAEWKKAGIIAMPGVGFDVVPSDCLAAMLRRELPSATHLRMAFTSKNGKLSPGTTKTMIEGMSQGTRVRRDGRIIELADPLPPVKIPFASGEKLCVAISWGDVSTAFHSTGIPNIEIYLGVPEDQIKRMQPSRPMRWVLGLGFVQSIMKSQVTKRIKGPNEAERKADEMQLWGEVADPSGRKATIRMRTPEGYDFTVDSSLAAVAKVLEGNLPPGALTPSKAFGADFVKSLTGVRLEPTP